MRIDLDAMSLFEAGAFSGGLYVPTKGFTTGLNPLIPSKTDRDQLAVLSHFTAEHASVPNLGLAGEGTVLQGSWIADPDGFYALRNGRVQFPFHGSLITEKKASPYYNTYSYSGAVMVRNATAGTLAQREGVFKLLLSDGGTTLTMQQTVTILETRSSSSGQRRQPVGTEVNGFSVSLSSGFFANEWVLVSWTITPSSTIVSFNNNTWISERMEEDRTSYSYVTPMEFGGTDFVGDMAMLYALGTGTSYASSLLSHTGAWTSEKIDLATLWGLSPGQEAVFERASHAGFLNADHAATLGIRMSDNQAFTQIRSQNLNLATDHFDFGSDKRYVTTQYLHGTWLQLTARVSANALATLKPRINDLVLTFRVK